MPETSPTAKRTRYVEPTFAEVSSFDDVCYSGEEGYPTSVVYDSRQFTRKEAIRRYGIDYTGDPRHVRCRVAYARWLDRDEQWEHDMDRWWEYWLEDHWDEDTQGLPPDAPGEPPEDYEPDEDSPAWDSCKRTDVGAVRVYRCSDGGRDA